jgi:hypothetical protein
MHGVLRSPVTCILCGFSAPVQVSTVLGAALEEQRKEGEYIEGIAIWVAVAIVIMVGEFPWQSHSQELALRVGAVCLLLPMHAGTTAQRCRLAAAASGSLRTTMGSSANII